MREAPAPLRRQPFHLEREEIHVVGARGEPLEELGPLADMQARLHARPVRAEIGEQPRRHGARLRLGGKPQNLDLGLAPRFELLVCAREAVQELVARLAQGMAGAGEMQVASALRAGTGERRCRPVRFAAGALRAARRRRRARRAAAYRIGQAAGSTPAPPRGREGGVGYDRRP